MCLSKKYFILLILLFFPFLFAGQNYYMRGGGVAETTCQTYDSETTAESSISVGQSADRAILGQSGYVPSANSEVCQIDFNIYTIVGDISGVDYVARIYNMSGTSLGDDPTGCCTSAPQKITGLGWHSSAKFTGLSCQLVTTGSYGIVIMRADNSYDVNNYINVMTKGTNGALSGNAVRWQQNLTIGAALVNDVTIIISTQQ